MGWIHKKIIRPLLFRQDSEIAHNQAVNSLALLSRDDCLLACVKKIYGAPELPTEVFGLKFPNPVGLAAGMDKHASAVPGWAALGFGFCELGGVTWHSQEGNPKPRMFRAIPDEAVINRMGFNNSGAEAVAQKLSDWKESGCWPAHPVGINLGKSKITPLENAAGDYANSFRTLRDLADFFVVNVSSPNTPNLRQLQDKAALNGIFQALQALNNSQAGPKPILVKVAPDLSISALDEIVELVKPCKIAGIVATNTTISRPSTDDSALKKIYAETGGLSGKPLRMYSTEIVRHLYKQTGGQVPIIGVGGIFSAEDAWEKITAGASLVQCYTGLVYEGPALAGKIVRGLNRKLDEAGYKNIRQAVGKEA
ncbi:MAG TPA: quinone-dependent dihydroorotate dehydrogenase [Candidatus Acidoferrales bacterium]|jgi:dihydroorotate dehydrogenase|nr:quinone-dependent dihydroorotate dehydrogenase [Candidatus Acidoferrales bacterium]